MFPTRDIKDDLVRLAWISDVEPEDDSASYPTLHRGMKHYVEGATRTRLKDRTSLEA
jgi:hypothetical protein